MTEQLEARVASLNAALKAVERQAQALRLDKVMQDREALRRETARLDFIAFEHGMTRSWIDKQMEEAVMRGNWGSK